MERSRAGSRPFALSRPTPYNRMPLSPFRSCIVTTAETAEIILYTHPDCPFSAQAKMHYRRQRIPYTEIDVSKQPDRIPDLLELSGGERITPIIVENGAVTIGFQGGF